jgi:beta-N-acetylhexosaminidase
MPPRAFITGCADTALTADERRFMTTADPWGLILFKRNCADPAQISRLVESFRDAVGRADAPVLIDEEGGRIQRLEGPGFRRYPGAGQIGAIGREDRALGRRAAWLHGRLIAEDLFGLGITVDCLPVLDLRYSEAHPIIGDRAFGGSVDIVAEFGRAQAEGLMAGGIAPIMKHMPGHGRARLDSHEALPVVEASLDELKRLDFAPFARCRDLPMAMTAHIVYPAVDPVRPATTSAELVGSVIRDFIGFDGLLMSDDVSMKALSGSMEARTEAALRAGCDMALHCNGSFYEMEAVASAAPRLSGRALQRADNAIDHAKRRQEADIGLLREEFESLLVGAA